MSQGWDESQEPVSWDRVEGRQGDGRYTFQLASGGLLATLTAPRGAKLTLPMVAWEGLLDALAAQRKTRTRAGASFPRARARAGRRARPARSPPPSRPAARSASSPARTAARSLPSKPSSTARAYGTASTAGRRGGRIRANAGDCAERADGKRSSWEGKGDATWPASTAARVGDTRASDGAEVDAPASGMPGADEDLQRQISSPAAGGRR